MCRASDDSGAAEAGEVSPSAPASSHSVQRNDAIRQTKALKTASTRPGKVYLTSHGLSSQPEPPLRTCERTPVLERPEPKFDSGPNAISPSSYFQKSGIYVFLISFASAYYLINAPLLLSHWDLGWHLAAGDLIRDQGSIPFQDPWSFTSGGRQWFNLSWLWDVIASVIFQYTKFSGLILFVVACGSVIVGYLTSACLGCGASATAVCIAVLSACLLYPAFAGAYPNIYLAVSPNISTMLFCVIFYGNV